MREKIAGLTNERKRDRIADILCRNPAWSNRAAAVAAGVDPKTVIAIRAAMIAEGDIPQLDVLRGADGKHRPAKRSKRRGLIPPRESNRSEPPNWLLRRLCGW